MGRFDGRTAIVTGAAGGIGEEYAKALAAERANVVVADVSTENGERVAADIVAAGGRAVFQHTDVSDPDSANACAEVDYPTPEPDFALSRIDVPADGDAAREFVSRVEVGMVGVNVPIPVPIAYHTFGGWKKSGFGDLNQHGPESIKFYSKVKTVTQRWPSGIKDGADFNIPTMD